MKHYINFAIVLLLFSSKGFSQNFTAREIAVNTLIEGTLLVPSAVEQPALAIIIAGSGPVDRNGNQNFARNNSLKKLAEGLTNNGIATFRYDKRTIKLIATGKLDNTIMFDDFVTDAIDVVNYFKSQNAYSKIYIIGHSQGSLIGMIAAEKDVDGFISIAGASQTIDKIIIKQVEQTAPAYLEDTKKIFSVLQEGKTTSNYPPVLSSFLGKDIQPFMINWMQYNPQDILKSLQIPILIVNGTNDLQVGVEDANRLKDSNPNAELKLIDKMNHVLFIVEGDDLVNFKSYNEAHHKVSAELIDTISSFITK